MAARPPGAGCAQCWQVQERLRIYAQAVQLVLQEAQEREQAEQCEVQALQAHVAQLQQAVQQQQLNVAAGSGASGSEAGEAPVGREASNAPAATVQPGALVVAAVGCQQGKDEQAIRHWKRRWPASGGRTLHWRSAAGRPRRLRSVHRQRQLRRGLLVQRP